ncbi:hydroxylysine kinase-like [Ostrea edulis]|uniref:hydroxylysine kinase-like n=1 Tax=Ostrea edulis TaxID=37623 RepID=UPI0024AEA85D|nr:hydroxylysine kinase-like [Ostrea edulis]XP_048746696.2 hydroxylysine kinase-like [Ostrea edulis]
MTDENETVLNPGEKVQPRLGEQEACHLVHSLYGLSTIKVEELNSYDDKNFHIHVDTTTSGDVKLSEDGYVLKILNSLDSRFPEAIDAQNRLILHVSQRGICTSCPLPNLQNKLCSLEHLEESDKRYIVRLFTFIPGKVFVGVRYTPFLVHSVGKLAGKLDTACSDFYDPAFNDHKRIWSLTEVPKLTKFFSCLKEEKKRQTVLSVLKQFDDSVVSNYRNLKKGVIHGDLSDNNILITPSSSSPDDYEVVGFLDFGDATIAYYVFEIAILICYILLGADAKDDPIQLAGHALAGYLSEFPLPTKDLTVLRICISARLVQSLVMGAYTASAEPSNTDYVLQTQTGGWELLYKFCVKSDTEVFNSWRKTLLQYNLKFDFK